MVGLVSYEYAGTRLFLHVSKVRTWNHFFDLSCFKEVRNGYRDEASPKKDLGPLSARNIYRAALIALVLIVSHRSKWRNRAGGLAGEACGEVAGRLVQE